MTEEEGTPDSGNPFNIEGETGMEYLYDGLYRSVFGKTFDGTGSLTEVDSVFNTLSGLERQRQRVLRAHPNNSSFNHEHTLFGSFDESGRRYQRTNPSGITRVSWDFDRKHRPFEELVELYDANGGGWLSPQTTAEYEYLGGGLLHSRQTRYMADPGGLGTFPFVSNFERDNLLRLTKVRHHRDDTGLDPTYGDRLIGRYDYAYNENSMMGYEARWYHDDTNNTSVTPDETDFYFYDTIDRLEKATYGATKYGNNNTITSSLLDDAYSVFGDDTDNAGTFSDRIYYARRKTGTRDKVNWVRGAASGSSSSLPSRNDTNSAPDQTTNYTTTDDPTADPDNPTGDGEGSRHNYTVIGQVSLQYDKKRNVIADATREFRYNYRSQLRRVIRKSDGDDISQYREDAYGRRVQAITYWELGRQAHFDTRFNLDVEMDFDADATEMKYVDGGITSDQDPGPGDTDQRAAWASRLNRNVGDADEHYIDFFVYVPDGEELGVEYLGFIGYEDIELRIFADRYELWDAITPQLLDDFYPDAGTAGFHNIGLRFSSISPGVWIDGEDTGMTNTSAIDDAMIYFGTHNLGEDEETVDGLLLLECLTYQRSFYRTSEEQNPLTGGPRVTLHFFDGPQVVTTEEVYDAEDPDTGEEISPYIYIDAVSTTEQHRFDSNSDRTPEIFLPNGRRATGQVVRPASDAYVNDEGDVVASFEEAPLPGVAITLLTDSVGGTRCFGRVDPALLANPDSYGTDTGNTEVGVWTQDELVQRFAVTYPQTPDVTTFETSEPTYFGEPLGHSAVGVDVVPTDGDDICACNGDDKTTPDLTATVCVATELRHQDFGGVFLSPDLGIQYSVGHVGPIGPEVFGDVDTYWRDLLGDCTVTEYMDNIGRVTRGGAEGGVKVLKEAGEGAKIVVSNPGQVANDVGQVAEAIASDPAAVADALAASLGEFYDDLLGVNGSDKQWEAIDALATELFIVAGTAGLAVGTKVAVQAARKAAAAGMSKAQKAAFLAAQARAAKHGSKLADLADKLDDIAKQADDLAGNGKCFIAGTLIWVLKDELTIDEALRLLFLGVPIWVVADLASIEKITVGMYVLSRHESSDAAPLTFSRVGETYVRRAPNLVQITTASSASGPGGSVIATEEHPFWVSNTHGRSARLAEPTASGATHTKVYADDDSKNGAMYADHGWMFAADLQVGDKLATPSCTGAVTVSATKSLHTGTTTVYNFAVEETHTYFIAPSNAPNQAIWVHNNKCGGKGDKGADNKPKSSDVKKQIKEMNTEKSRAKGVPEREIGPSGKPKIHVKDKGTRKRAQDAAQADSCSGGTPENHVNPTVGDPHYHPAGSKRRSHYAYPRKGYPPPRIRPKKPGEPDA